MPTPQQPISHRDTLARSATAWLLCSLAGLPVLLGLCAIVLDR